MLASKLRPRTPSRAREPPCSSCRALASSSQPHCLPIAEEEAKSSPASCTRAIRSASQLGRFRHALSLYARMHAWGHRVDPFAIATALKACARIPSKPLGSAIHAHVLKLGHHSNVYSQTALVGLYTKVDAPEAARIMFDEMPVKNVVSWNSILSSYVRAGDLKNGQNVFDEMPLKDVVSWNSMVSGYAKAGHLERAAALFHRMPVKNAASWNGMISAYIDHGDMGSARYLFDKMPDRSNVSWIAMISGYSKHGDVNSASKLFQKMEERDVFSWNVMIACYAQNGCPRDAIQLFNRMRKPEANVQPDEMTFSSIISACSQLGDLRFGSWMEEYMCSVGMELDDHLGTALIDLYSKCGSMERARELFNGLRKRDIVSYSAMILGCGINGKSSEAIDLFNEMLDAKIAPNAVTFVGILTAYNHAGLVEEARRCFASMWSRHGVIPLADHYAVMVDLLGRSGRMEEAHGLIKEMPMRPHVGVWGALLLACRLHGNVELGEIAAHSCFELEPKASGYYVLLASIYAEAGKWDKAKNLWKIMAEKGLNKIPGCSWMQPGLGQ